MADPETIGGAAGGGSLLGAFFTWLGLKGQISDLKEGQKELKIKIDEKQPAIQCAENHKDIKEIFKEIKTDVKDIKQDMKEVTKDIKQDIKLLAQKFDTYRTTRNLDE